MWMDLAYWVPRHRMGKGRSLDRSFLYYEVKRVFFFVLWVRRSVPCVERVSGNRA
jgi:hypothetical protein